VSGSWPGRHGWTAGPERPPRTGWARPGPDRPPPAIQLARDAACLCGHESGPFDTWLPEPLAADHHQVLDVLLAVTLDANGPAGLVTTQPRLQAAEG
jgi:hypothetical protein